ASITQAVTNLVPGAAAAAAAAGAATTAATASDETKVPAEQPARQSGSAAWTAARSENGFRNQQYPPSGQDPSQRRDLPWEGVVGDVRPVPLYEAYWRGDAVLFLVFSWPRRREDTAKKLRPIHLGRPEPPTPPRRPKCFAPPGHRARLA